MYEKAKTSLTFPEHGTGTGKILTRRGILNYKREPKILHFYIREK